MKNIIFTETTNYDMIEKKTVMIKKRSSLLNHIMLKVLLCLKSTKKLHDSGILF